MPVQKKSGNLLNSPDIHWTLNFYNFISWNIPITGQNMLVKNRLILLKFSHPFIYFFFRFLLLNHIFAKLAGIIEYTYCFFAEG